MHESQELAGRGPDLLIRPFPTSPSSSLGTISTTPPPLSTTAISVLPLLLSPFVASEAVLEAAFAAAILEAESIMRSSLGHYISVRQPSTE